MNHFHIRLSILVVALLFMLNRLTFAQEVQVPSYEVASIINFLASDELQGRKTGEPGNWIAARYIGESFRAAGLETVGDSYYQEIHFRQLIGPTTGSMTIDSLDFDLADNMVLMEGPGDTVTAELLYAGYGWQEDLADLDLTDKYVLALMGAEDAADAQAALGMSSKKATQVQEAGAAGLIEIYTGRVPWSYVKRYLQNPRMVTTGGTTQAFNHLMINGELDQIMKVVEDGSSTVSLTSDGVEANIIRSPNVVAYLEGVDPTLRDEYLVLSAHYDHVGTRSGTTEEDTIYNGARDNAIGCAALIQAAHYLSEKRPRRSVLFVAFTAEEMGLLGSEYFVENPPIPLNQMVFNLNTDGAGYNDTTIISVMGLDRTSVSGEIRQAITSVGLEPFSDPAPEQNLFDRSDNVSFARMGIPAPTFSPGFKEFNQDIMKNYHQVSDEATDLDYAYLSRFCEAYIRAAALIANRKEQPHWITGDKYEEAFQQLFQLK